MTHAMLPACRTRAKRYGVLVAASGKRSSTAGRGATMVAAAPGESSLEV